MANKKQTAAKTGKKDQKRMKKGTYRFFKFLFILFTVLVVLIVGALAAFYAITGRVKPEEEKPHEKGSIEDLFDQDKGDLDDKQQQEIVDMINGLKESSDLETMLRDWAKNNTANSYMHDSDVMNVLLVGADKGDANTDVMMLVSVNQKTKKIFLSSFMRDSYTYIETDNGGYCSKMNAAYAGGGMKALVETVQNDYKIRVDNYVKVGFDTFIEVVDIVGGIDNIALQDYEIREMRRISVTEQEKTEASKLTAGDSVHLNGTQALLFCRIRKCYTLGDVKRTENQRVVISALIDQFGGVSVSQATTLVNTLLKYVKTDMGSTEMLSLATKAVMNKWYEYELVKQALPAEGNRMDYMGKAWIWVVDYPQDAVDLQMSIYGKTNIRLDENRRTALDLMRGR